MTESVFNKLKYGLVFYDSILNPLTSTAASFSINSMSKEFLSPSKNKIPAVASHGFIMNSQFVAAYSPKRHSVG
jgi:hypothetical protein